MKKFFTALSVTLGIILGSGTMAYALDTTKLKEQVLSATVQLNKNCSGQIVKSGEQKKDGVGTYVLTAKHCADGMGDKLNDVDIPIYNKNNRVVRIETYKAKVYRTSWSSDLALLKFIDNETVIDHTVKIAPKDTEIPMGADVLTVGYPAGLALTVTNGLFGSRESIPYPSPSKDTEYFRATPAVIGGNSGGGLYMEDANGDYTLIGVVSAGFRSAPHMTFYVPVNEVQEFLEPIFNSEFGQGNKVTPATH